MIKKLLLAGLVLLLLSIGYMGFRFVRYEGSTLSEEHSELVVSIPPGSSVGAVGRILEENGLVADASEFRMYVRVKRAGGALKAGEFRFYRDMSPPELLDVLTKGEEVRYKVTFPEGRNIQEMGHALADIPFMDGKKFVKLARDPQLTKELLSDLGIDAPTLEGYLFPSTYELARSQSERDLIQIMVKQHKALWSSAWIEKAKALGLSRGEVVTLASIVEKETGNPDERTMVASVFHNRLTKKMKLESDPTIIFGLENYDGDIKRSDIRRAHPWNTYVIPGLPPSPITNPGKGAIEATLFPAQSEFLYFVAKDRTTHSFSRTYAEHAAKVIEYQILRRSTSIPTGQAP